MQDSNVSLKQFAKMIKNSSKKNSNNNSNNNSNHITIIIKNKSEKPKQAEIYSIEWLCEQCELIAMLKLQETDIMLDVDLLIFQMLEIVHSESGNIESILMDTLCVESFEFMSLLINKRGQIVSKTKNVIYL